MALSAGTRLGPYEIVALIGAGGMGEVYRAHDPRMGRDVAVKVSAERFSDRFSREVHAVAALNHPNICQLYDVGPDYLVMELVEGPTLADRIKSGPLPLEEALTIARHVAEALEAAHEKGVVHRDLKPANIKAPPDGMVKVLDFGLATAVQAETRATGEHSPTLTMGTTEAGVILGTAAYMSPEQAAGKPVDRRADIWSFGVVFWEMLTGKRLFGGGETVSHTLADVLRAEIDFTKLPDSTPAQIRELLRRCLDRDVKTRLRDIGEARVAIQRYLANPEGEAETRSTSRLAWAVVGVLAAAGAALAWVHFRETAPPARTLRYTISAPERSTVHSFAISPDGRLLVIAAAVGGKRQLWLRAMDALQAQPMAFTEDATYPFWSPDGHYIGFFAQGKLKKVAASGGPAQSLCDVPLSRGGSWSRDDVIVFSPAPNGISIQRVSAAGGVPVDVMKTKGNQRHPMFLPDGRHFLYLTSGANVEKSGIYMGSLDGKESRRVLADVSGVAFAPPSPNNRTGHILFVRENTLMALPFDAASAQVSGDVFPVAVGVSLTTNNTYVPATVSENGVLLYATGGSAGGISQIGWYDRAGMSLGPVGMPGTVFHPAISPDEKSIVFTRATSGGGDIWVQDLNSRRETRFTSDASNNVTPSWSPKGDHIVFASNRSGGVYNLYQRVTSGSGQDEPLLPNSASDYPSQWSRDGRFIVYIQADPKTSRDLWVLPTNGATADRKPMPFLRTEFDELLGQFSPDSHWMAFTSDRSGQREVYVRPFPSGEGEWTISIGGGQAPRWRGDGKELFFEAANGKMMAVPVKASTGTKPFFDPGAPVALFDAHVVNSGNEIGFEYDVTADGKRFLINTASGPSGASALPLTVVVNWLASAKK
ncbi:MAG TPA: protein kinase [Bryobacteraceae bacterium]|jgi:Tol biopolymer transport system component|nr:protein kinase [Bryobacteraceae bacterium]